MIGKAVIVPIACCVLLAIGCTDGGSSNRKPSNIDDLRPGTTLHVSNVHFHRHGPADDVLAQSESYQPETLHNETWITFDEQGKAISTRGEMRDEDGKLWNSSRSEGADMVSVDATGKETRSAAMLLGVTVESTKEAYANAQRQSLALWEEHPDAPIVKIGSVDTRMIDTIRKPSGSGQDVTPGNYVSVYVYDLRPVEEIRRAYISAAGIGLRSETVVVDARGIETVVERSENVYEVLP